jgi:hypothetical protein
MRDIFILDEILAQDKIYTVKALCLPEIFYFSLSTGIGFEL